MADRISRLLVAADIDGTILRARCGIPRANMDAIERFVGRGGRFTVATGRSVQSVRNYLPWLQLSAPAILCNGAQIYDFNIEKTIYSRRLDLGAREILSEVHRAFPNVGIEVYPESGDIIAVRSNEQVTQHALDEHISLIYSDLATVEDGWLKVLFADTPANINRVSVFIEKRIADDERYRAYTFVRTGDVYYEMVAPDVNKGAGLRKLAELMGINLKYTAAIGDYYNDISMLDAAGYSAAVGNAPAEVRAFADVTVTECLRGGLGQFLDSIDSACNGYEQIQFDMQEHQQTSGVNK